jgi:hypothetical protein
MKFPGHNASSKHAAKAYNDARKAGKKPDEALNAAHKAMGAQLHYGGKSRRAKKTRKAKRTRRTFFSWFK